MSELDYTKIATVAKEAYDESLASSGNEAILHIAARVRDECGLDYLSALAVAIESKRIEEDWVDPS